jgi:predicted nucleic acid-binding protein
MNNHAILLDTNLWIYLYTTTPKSQTVKQLINENFRDIMISTQILGEMYHVLTRKNLQSPEAANRIVAKTMENFAVKEIGILNVTKAMEIHACHHYSYWDSLIIATALLNKVSLLYSEDMQHNHLIENKIRILNQFYLM